MQDYLSKRQSKLLKIIIDLYIKTAVPVGSKVIAEHYLKGVSAATIRNEMAYLEKTGFIEKNYTSSGRIPSVKGYKFYEKHFSTPELKDQNIKFKLKKVFNNRNISINMIIEESCKIIAESLNLPVVTLEIDENVLLKRIDLVKINNQNALVIVILSNGSLTKNMVHFDNENVLKDIAICIRIFNDRLLDCPILEIPPKLEVLKKIIQEKVQEYEFVMQEIIERIFNFPFQNKIIKNIHNQKALLEIPEFQDRKDKLKELLELFEDTTIWEQIAYKQNLTGGATHIIFGDEIDKHDLIFAQTKIELHKQNKTELFMVAPTRVDYGKVKGLLEFIKHEFQKGWKANQG